MALQFETQENRSVTWEEMTQGQKTLVVFVRHLG